MWFPYKGLDKKQIDKIRSQAVYPVFIRIEKITGVPWQAMAAIWYRESFSVASPKTPGGPWQFDPVPGPKQCLDLLNRFTTLSLIDKAKLIKKGVTDFESGGILAACFFRTKTKDVIFPDVSDTVIKDAIWGYNGKAYGSADKSPYVVNGLTVALYPMRLKGTIPDKNGKRIPVDISDYRPGAFTIFKQLKALFPKSIHESV